MYCTACGKEYDDSAAACPECGHEPAANPSPDLAATLSGPSPEAGWSSTLSVSGSSSIRSRLRPRGVFGILGEAFRLYFRHFKVLVPLFLLLSLPFIFIDLCQICTGSRPDGVSGGNASPIQSILGVIFQFLVIRAASNAYLGRPLSMRRLLTLDTRSGGFIGANFLSSFAIVGAAIIPGVITVAVATSSGMAKDLSWYLKVSGCGALTVCALIAVGCWLSVSGPAAVVEGTGGRASLVRSARLVRGFFWKAVGTLCIGALVALLIWLLLILPVVCVIAFGGVSAMVSNVTVMIAANVGLVLALPLFWFVVVLFYYDLRIRKEGFDLQMLSEQLGSGVQPPEPIHSTDPE